MSSSRISVNFKRALFHCFIVSFFPTVCWEEIKSSDKYDKSKLELASKTEKNAIHDRNVFLLIYVFLYFILKFK